MMTAPALMAKARTAYESARALLERKDRDGACNRAYYAMFDAARAALLATKAEVTLNVGKTHSGVLTAFSQHLVKNGPVPHDIGRLLKRAEETRTWPTAAATRSARTTHSDLSKRLKLLSPHWLHWLHPIRSVRMRRLNESAILCAPFIPAKSSARISWFRWK